MHWTLHLLTFGFGYVYATAVEWSVHRFIFHGLGKRYKALSFHWAQHHRAVRQHEGGDPSYHSSVFSWSAHGREFWGVAVGLLLHTPLIPYLPGFFLGAMVVGLNYARIHRKSHVDPAWCRRSLPWHWDHHMGKNPDANWCVTNEWFDKLMGTRELGPASKPEP
jgi:sterol desaturase/sphingolipid hydroxylase (fatty acid hydroxylase superfamily)